MTKSVTWTTREKNLHSRALATDLTVYLNFCFFFSTSHPFDSDLEDCEVDSWWDWEEGDDDDDEDICEVKDEDDDVGDGEVEEEVMLDCFDDVSDGLSSEKLLETSRAVGVSMISKSLFLVTSTMGSSAELPEEKELVNKESTTMNITIRDKADLE